MSASEGGSEVGEARQALEEAHEVAQTDVVEQEAAERAIEDDVYERILVNTPDVVRDLMKDVIVNKYANDLDDAGSASGAGANEAAVRPKAGSIGSEEGNLTRSHSQPLLDADVPYPDVATASEINVPQGFRREFVINEVEDEEEVPPEAKVPFLEALLASNSAVLYAWVDDGLNSDDEDYESDEDLETSSTASPARRFPMVFSSYGRHSFVRRASDFANDQTTKADSRKTLFTLFKCFVATGVMFLPSGFRTAGLAAGIVTLLAIGAISLYGMLILMETRAFVQRGEPEATPSTPLLSEAAAAAVTNTLFPPKPRACQSYSALGRIVLGRFGKRLVETSILFSQLGFCCVYVSFTGNTISQALELVAPGEVRPLWVYMVGSMPFIVPLTFIRYLKHFAIPNMIANVFVLISLLYIMGYSAQRIAAGRTEANNWDCTGDKSVSACLWIARDTFPMFLGSSVYVFEGITMIIPIQNSMREPEKLPRMLWGVMPFVTSMFCAFGAICFYAYAQETEAIIITNMPEVGNVVVSVMFVFVALFMFPLMAFPAAQIVERRFFKKQRRSGKKWQKNFIRTCIVLLCVGVSIAAGPKVDKLVSLIGGLFCVPLALVFPPLFYIKSGCAQDFWREVLPASIVLVLGGLAACFSTFVAVQNFGASE